MSVIMNLVGIKHGTKVVIVNKDNYHDIGSIARNTNGAVKLGSGVLPMLSNVADLFGNISDRNLNYKQKNAIVD